MKKSILLLLIVSIVSGLSACTSNDKPIPTDQLPEKALVFLKQYFYGVDVISVEKDKKTYEVKLAEGSAVEFDKHGEWKEVECSKGIPGAIIPQGVFKYVASKYDRSVRMVKIERTKHGYEVDLSNKVELIFDKNGNFVRVDD